MVVPVLVVLVLVLTATALPSEYNRDIFHLIHGDSTNTSSLSTRPNTETLTTSTKNPPTSTSQPVASQWTPTPTSQPNSTVSTTNTTSTPSVVPASAESQPTDHSSKTWQIIGVAIISILFIATSITCAMFFDRLWRFLREVVCCTSSPVASEEFLPDSETQSWDTKTLSPPGFSNYQSDSLREEPSTYTRARELPWNTDTQDWATLHRHPSRRNDHPPPA